MYDFIIKFEDLSMKILSNVDEVVAVVLVGKWTVPFRL
jgi:hypothetical protein